MVRNCTYPNIMMDASNLYPFGFHPVNTDSLPDGCTPARSFPRSSHPVKYYLTNFKNATKNLECKESLLGTLNATSIPVSAKIMTSSCMKKDIIMFGETLRKNLFEVSLRSIRYTDRGLTVVFAQKYSNLEFLRPLIDKMVLEPSVEAGQALRDWSEITGRLCWVHREWSLRPRKRKSVWVSARRELKSLLRVAAYPLRTRVHFS